MLFVLFCFVICSRALCVCAYVGVSLNQDLHENLQIMQMQPSCCKIINDDDDDDEIKMNSM